MVNRRPDPARETALTESLAHARSWLDLEPDPLKARAIFTTGFVEGWDTRGNHEKEPRR